MQFVFLLMLQNPSIPHHAASSSPASPANSIQLHLTSQNTFRYVLDMAMMELHKQKCLKSLVDHRSLSPEVSVNRQPRALSAMYIHHS